MTDINSACEMIGGMAIGAVIIVIIMMMSLCGGCISTSNPQPALVIMPVTQGGLRQQIVQQQLIELQGKAIEIQQKDNLRKGEFWREIPK